MGFHVISCKCYCTLTRVFPIIPCFWYFLLCIPYAITLAISLTISLVLFFIVKVLPLCFTCRNLLVGVLILHNQLDVFLYDFLLCLDPFLSRLFLWFCVHVMMVYLEPHNWCVCLYKLWWNMRCVLDTLPNNLFLCKIINVGVYLYCLVRHVLEVWILHNQAWFTPQT